MYPEGKDLDPGKVITQPGLHDFNLCHFPVCVAIFPSGSQSPSAKADNRDYWSIVQPSQRVQAESILQGIQWDTLGGSKLKDALFQLWGNLISESMNFTIY